MANYLDYDIYDVELASVATNTDLRRMFIESKAKSIIMIEDIDCSLNLSLTSTRSKKKPPASTTGDAAAEESEPSPKPPLKAGKEQHPATDPTASKVTLSGLLNFIDGLWSACGGERIVVFTTNHVERLDPALVRRGRMDKHIEMSYCCFEAFKFLTQNYLAVDAHPLFDSVNTLLQEVDITPADVAELLTPKRAADDADSCLAELVAALEKKTREMKKPALNLAHEEQEVVEDE